MARERCGVWQGIASGILGLGLVIGGGCDEPEEGGCDPGTFQDCTCPDGTPSDRECLSDRTFDACFCEDLGDGGTPDGGAPDGGGPSGPFDPMVHGFSFENYGNEMSPMNLTPVEVQRLFGDGVCEPGTSGASCNLTPQAQRWMQQTSDGMDHGHCEGMAVLSERFYLGLQDPNDFGGANANALQFSNGQLQRELGYWWTTQDFAREQKMAPADIVAALRTSFDGSGSEGYTLGIYQRDRTGGHAITPYAIRDGSTANQVEILAYDNNYPNMERVVTVDTAANTWAYNTSTSPSVPNSDYGGDATSETIGLTTMSMRNGPFQCDFCGSYTAGMSGTRRIETTGDARVLIQNESGQRLGHLTDDTVIEEIPGGEVINGRSADLWADREEPTYRVPGGSELQIFITDADPAVNDETTLGVSGPGYFLGVEDVMLDSGQSDEVVIGRDTAFISYHTLSLETPIVVVAAQTDAADWLIAMRSRASGADQAINASVDFDAGGVFDFDFSGVTDFDLYILRIDGADELEFFQDVIPVNPGELFSIFFGDFDVDGEMLVLEVYDAGGSLLGMVDLLDETGTL